jgi:hypothetical protein
MQHLTEEQLVSHYYRDGAPPAAAEHLVACAECRGQYETIRRVLELMNDASIPERPEQYGEKVWNSVRWKLGSSRRRSRWQSIAAVAAMLAFAFFAGYLWRPRTTPSSTIATTQTVGPVAQQDPEAKNRVLLVVLGDHLDSSERVLLDFVNSDPSNPSQLVSQQKRAGELVSANRIYRATATDRGDDRVAELLADLEPVLMELANTNAQANPERIERLQKRIDEKGLLFKVRVLGAQVTAAEEKGTSL